jgi:hypothetical protein
MGYLWIAVGLALGGLLQRTRLMDFAPAAAESQPTTRADRMTSERRRRVRSVQRPATTRTARARRRATKRAAA